MVLGNGCFAAGQLYTALSRVRTFEGLTLDREIKENDLYFAPEVVDFYEKIISSSQPEEKTVTLDVPAAYAEKIKMMLAEMIAKENVA